MALADNALTTLVTVLDELGIPSDAGAGDARFERYINAASAVIEAHVGRRLAYNAAVVENLRAMGSPHLLLSVRPVVAVDSVEIDGAAVASTSYALRDLAHGIPGVLEMSGGWPWAPALIVEHAEVAGVAGTERQIIQVTYSGGYVTPEQATEELPRTLPHDLEDACILMVSTRWRARGKDMRVVSEGYEGSSFTFGGVPMPPEILGILERYTSVS